MKLYKWFTGIPYEDVIFTGGDWNPGRGATPNVHQDFEVLKMQVRSLKKGYFGVTIYLHFRYLKCMPAFSSAAA